MTDGYQPQALGGEVAQLVVVRLGDLQPKCQHGGRQLHGQPGQDHQLRDHHQRRMNNLSASCSIFHISGGRPNTLSWMLGIRRKIAEPAFF